MEISLYPAYNVLSKMIHADPAMRNDIMCIGGTSQWPATIFRGTDQWGEPYGYILVDPIGGAIGAFATGDGISTGGQSRTPICKLPNVEHTEQTFPLLFLYRKEVIDSGGAGKFRAGSRPNPASFLTTPRSSRRIPCRPVTPSRPRRA